MAKITTTYADRDVQYPNRYTFTNVSGTTYDVVRAEGTVNVAGTLLNATILDEIKTSVNDLYDESATKLNNDGWYPFPTTLAYSSVDSPTGVMTTGADTRSYLEQGMKIKYDQAQGLTAYWDLNANSNSQVGSFNGTDTNITYSAGKFSNCAVFNGTTSKIEFTDSASLKPTGAFTIGAWVKTSVGGFIFQSYSQNTNRAGVCLGSAAGIISYQFANNTTTSSTFRNNSVPTITDNNWHFVVLTFNNNWAQLYFDGNLVASSYEVTPAYAATNYPAFGVRRNDAAGYSEFMNGSIDDVFLINGYALSEEHIRAKYIAGTAQGSSAFTVTKTAFVSSDPTATTITAYHGTDSMLVNDTISNIYYSKVKKPLGFNTNPLKWAQFFKSSIEVSTATPTNGTWYNYSGHNLSVPIGAWNIGYEGNLGGVSTAGITGVRVQATLSTTNNGDTDEDLQTYIGLSGASSTIIGLSQVYREKRGLYVPTKTTYYLNYRDVFGNCASLLWAGNRSKTIIFAYSTYL